MGNSFIKAIGALALMAFGTLALADPAARVGRMSSVQGDVTVRATELDAPTPALLNWPIMSGNRIALAPGARAEFRIGSAAVRLDGDSELEVTQLDDEHFQLFLDYGSASVRITNQDMLAGFELRTPQARVLLTEAGRVRIDAERSPDTSAIEVLAGAAQVDGGGASLALRSGKRAEIRGDDVHTGMVSEDEFDTWNTLRDERDDHSIALQYVGEDTTGYEELDQYGSWSDNPDYGPVWIPRAVPADWVPYRDGRWIWADPWGWTWVDQQPWGYAPSHYGRWVLLGQRWCWAPGRPNGRPVWAPALVGWVGDGQWSVSFVAGGMPVPARGWYPLSPRERFVPAYPASAAYVERINSAAVVGTGVDQRALLGRHDGVTVLPQDHFAGHAAVVVGAAPHGLATAAALRGAPLGIAPPPGMPHAPGVVGGARLARSSAPLSGTALAPVRGSNAAPLDARYLYPQHAGVSTSGVPPAQLRSASIRQLPPTHAAARPVANPEAKREPAQEHKPRAEDAERR